MRMIRIGLLVVLVLYLGVFVAAEMSAFSADTFSRGFYNIVHAWNGEASLQNTVALSDDGEDRVYAFKDGVVRLKKNSFTVYSSALVPYSNNAVVLRNPVFRTAGDRMLVFDRGNSAVYGFDSFERLFLLNVSGSVSNAGLSSGGFFYTVTDCDGYRGAVTVYDRDGNTRMIWKCADAYLLDGCFSSDTELSVVGLAPNRETTDLYLYRIDFQKGELLDTVKIPSDILFSVSGKSDGSTELITRTGVWRVRDGKAEVMFRFEDGNLPSHIRSTDSHTLLAVSRTTGETELVLLDRSGNVMFEQSCGEITDLALAAGKCYVLSPGTLSVLSAGGGTEAVYSVKSGVRSVFTDGTHIFLSSAHEVFQFTAEK